MAERAKYLFELAITVERRGPAWPKTKVFDRSVALGRLGSSHVERK
jgi:hypothetical protein